MSWISARREALLAALLAIADPSAAAALARHLRSEDAGLRNACVETLQAMPAAAASVLPALLADLDPDVRLLATEIVRTQPTADANRFLAGLLDAETQPNVCGAAVEVLAEVGTVDAVPALRTVRTRFAAEAFLPLGHRHRARSPRIGPVSAWPSLHRRSPTPTSRASASSSTGAPACCSRRPSATSSTGASPSACRPPASRSFAVYLARLRADADGEVEKLINAFTVNETYFYREDHQLRCLTSSLLPDLLARKAPGSTVRIWSMPCSTGEEPYSLAMWLLENWPEVDPYDIEIVGSDIDTRALLAAEEGLYGERALMRLSPDLVARYFELRGTRLGPAWRILADLRGSVRFTPATSRTRQAMATQGRFDVIFCRNVLIYFDDASRRLAADNLYDALLPGGFVCLGHTREHEPDLAAVQGLPLR